MGHVGRHHPLSASLSPTRLQLIGIHWRLHRTHSILLKHIWALWQVAHLHEPRARILVLEDDATVFHPKLGEV